MMFYLPSIKYPMIKLKILYKQMKIMTSYQKRKRCNGMAMDTLSKEMLLGIDIISFLEKYISSSQHFLL